MIAVTEYVKCEMCENNFCLNKIVSSKDGEYCKKCYEKIQLLLDKAKEEGYQRGWEDGSKGKVFEKIEVETEVRFKDLKDVIEGKEDIGEFLSKLKQ